MKRIIFLSLAIILTCMLVSSVSFAEKVIKIRLGHVAPPITVQHYNAEFFKKYVEAQSKGQLQVSIYPTGQLGGERVMAESVQTGTLEMALLTNEVTSNFVQETALYNIPFLFPDKASAQRVFESDVGRKIKKAYEKKGFKLLEYNLNGYRVFANNRKVIRTPEDLKPLKMRSIECPVILDAYNALGIKAIPLPFPDIYSALQQGVIDGLDMHLTGMWLAKVPVKYISLSPWILEPIVTIMNKNFFDQLPPDLQQIVREGAYEGKTVHMCTLATKRQEAIEALTAKGAEVTILTKEERKAFADLMPPVVDKWSKKVGEELFNEAIALIKAE
jgi:tripartite ATP-independent transporter DctP family solute receptor